MNIYPKGGINNFDYKMNLEPKGINFDYNPNAIKFDQFTNPMNYHNFLESPRNPETDRNLENLKEIINKIDSKIKESGNYSANTQNYLSYPSDHLDKKPEKMEKI
jgi:hypothetical protein